ncbi:hypothetical protein [Phytohabitans houttuyneae]|uniref:Uncharacterized protein n=1 Tax=Phytohabitans houttuyneae TaxID=1076126 RepID=A0A6V8KHL1_9ACTN|nr:hypothetical protein [Phytohabitans houttuyneae]GFJ83344.1 hypothetical protein Phou_075240 [Phytohabitans houttuyneae]
MPSLDGYTLSFAVVAVGGAVAAAIALVHGVAYKHDRAHERPVSDFDTSANAELAAVAGDYGDVPARR